MFVVEIYLTSGQTLKMNARDMSISVEPDTLEDGSANPRAGQLLGFGVDSPESDQLAYLYVSVPQVNALRATGTSESSQNSKPKNPPHNPSNRGGKNVKGKKQSPSSD